MGGCATTQPLKEFSGNPRVTISKVPRQKVLDQLFMTLLNSGYKLEQYKFVRDSGYEVQFSKKAESRLEAVLSSVFRSEAPAPDLTVGYVVSGDSDELRISARVTVAGAPGAPSAKAREFVNAENHRVQSILDDLKTSLRGK